jgi:hypothetical protein
MGEANSTIARALGQMARSERCFVATAPAPVRAVAASPPGLDSVPRRSDVHHAPGPAMAGHRRHGSPFEGRLLPQLQRTQSTHVPRPLVSVGSPPRRPDIILRTGRHGCAATFAASLARPITRANRRPPRGLARRRRRAARRLRTRRRTARPRPRGGGGRPGGHGFDGRSAVRPPVRHSRRASVQLPAGPLAAPLVGPAAFIGA